MRRRRKDIERSWYDKFCAWDREDRAAALKVLAILHDTIPERPAKPVDQPELVAQ